MLINSESTPSIDEVIILEGINGEPLQNVVDYDTDTREATIKQSLGFQHNNPLLAEEFGFSKIAYMNSIVTDAETGKQLRFNQEPIQ